MGVSQPPSEGQRQPVAVLSSVAPDVRIEEAADGDEQRVFLEGTMFHDGLNRNAWGLTEAGARRIADDLLDRDHIAAHPPIRNGQYDRAMTDGPGFPIGNVVQTDVVSVDEAMLDGGEYTASFVSEIVDPIYKARYQSGQYSTNDNFSVSIGIYGDPDAATCSVCDEQMAADGCDHDRFEKVEVENADGETETKIAGPLYGDGQADHLASVYMPAYEGAEANVTSAAVGESAGGLAATSVQTAGDVPAAASVLAEPFDAADEADPNPEAASQTDPETQRGYMVTLDASDEDERDSYNVRL